ncbi:hypothetical protein pb186bvf_006896 [Paramecium bursaria]
MRSFKFLQNLQQDFLFNLIKQINLIVSRGAYTAQANKLFTRAVIDDLIKHFLRKYKIIIVSLPFVVQRTLTQTQTRETSCKFAQEANLFFYKSERIFKNPCLIQKYIKYQMRINQNNFEQLPFINRSFKLDHFYNLY